jgi:hypothetical protein
MNELVRFRPLTAAFLVYIFSFVKIGTTIRVLNGCTPPGDGDRLAADSRRQQWRQTKKTIGVTHDDRTATTDPVGPVHCRVSRYRTAYLLRHWLRRGAQGRWSQPESLGNQHHLGRRREHGDLFDGGRFRRTSESGGQHSARLRWSTRSTAICSSITNKPMASSGALKPAWKRRASSPPIRMRRFPSVRHSWSRW